MLWLRRVALVGGVVTAVTPPDTCRLVAVGNVANAQNDDLWVYSSDYVTDPTNRYVAIAAGWERTLQGVQSTPWSDHPAFVASQIAFYFYIPNAATITVVWS